MKASRPAPRGRAGAAAELALPLLGVAAGSWSERSFLAAGGPELGGFAVALAPRCRQEETAICPRVERPKESHFLSEGSRGNIRR